MLNTVITIPITDSGMSAPYREAGPVRTIMLFATLMIITMAIWVIKLETPSWQSFRVNPPASRKLDAQNRTDLGRRKYKAVILQEAIWPKIVAIAAPFTPISHRKIATGFKIKFITAPKMVAAIE